MLIEPLGLSVRINSELPNRQRKQNKNTQTKNCGGGGMELVSTGAKCSLLPVDLGNSKLSEPVRRPLVCTDLCPGLLTRMDPRPSLPLGATVLSQHTSLTLWTLCPWRVCSEYLPQQPLILKESAFFALPPYVAPLENLSTPEVNRNPCPVNLMFLLPA